MTFVSGGTTLARYGALTAILIMGAVATARAEPVINNSGLTPQQCYAKDSECTQFCGPVVGDLRYECFSICDRMLDHCLDTGDWTDSLTVDPGTVKGPDRQLQLSAHLLAMAMTLADRDGDGKLTPKEIQAFKDMIYAKSKDGGSKGKPSQRPE
jgi:hypothetical protein